jgi:hypothetical protein
MRRAVLIRLLLAGFLLGGCDGADRDEDAWTRIDLVSANLAPGQALPVDSTITANIRTAITYGEPVSGVLVTEIRASGTLSRHSVDVDPDLPRLELADEIARVLDNSTSIARATRSVSGQDPLREEFDELFDVRLPFVVDSVGAPIGVFLLSYLGSGEIHERGDGTDTLIVTPFPFRDRGILPSGFELEASD